MKQGYSFLSALEKGKIVSQYLIEVFMIAVIAFGLSFFMGNAVANQLADKLIESPPSGENLSNDKNVVWDIKDDYGLSLDDVQVTIKDDSEISTPQNDEQNIMPPEAEVSVDIAETEQIHISVDILDMLQLYLIVCNNYGFRDSLIRYGNAFEAKRNFIKNELKKGVFTNVCI